MDDFEAQKWWYIGVNLIFWAALGSLALTINFVYGASGYGGTFPTSM
jgi:hypothetical protein